MPDKVAKYHPDFCSKLSSEVLPEDVSILAL